MILPSKHLSQRKTLLWVGADLLRHLKKPMSVSDLWERVQADEQMDISFDWFVLALDVLYIVGAVDWDEGVITRSAP